MRTMEFTNASDQTAVRLPAAAGVAATAGDFTTAGTEGRAETVVSGANPLQPVARAPKGLRCLRLPSGLWRVTRANGEVLGYIEQLQTPGGERHRAKRFNVRQRRFTEVGDFWRFDDAIDCLRFG